MASENPEHKSTLSNIKETVVGAFTNVKEMITGHHDDKQESKS